MEHNDLKLRIIYVDESGNTSSNEKSSKYLCLTACILSVSEKIKIEKEIRKIKKTYYQNPDIEFKSNFLRYANPSRPESSPLKLFDQEKYEEMMVDVKNMLIGSETSLISVLIDKKLFWKKYPSQNPYETAYAFLAERIQKELEKKDLHGMVIIDPREGGVEKGFIGDSIKSIHHKMRFGESSLLQETPRLVERLLYSSSDDTIGIQIADLFCYPIWHIFEYDKVPDTYEWFLSVSYPKIVCSDKGVLDGYGIKVFPDETRKTFNNKKDPVLTESTFDGRR